MKSRKQSSLSTSPSRKKRKETAEAGSENAAKAVESGENCVRRHPETAVWTAFGCGVALGGLIAWAIVEEREHHWRRHLKSLASNLQQRFS